MATISDPQLPLQVDGTAKTAALRVTCDLEFTELEVRSMNLIGLRYTLECQLLNMETLYADGVISFAPQQLPRVRDAASQFELPVFEAIAAKHDLQRYIFREDSLVAELRLSNQDLRTVSAKRTPATPVDLAA